MTTNKRVSSALLGLAFAGSLGFTAAVSADTTNLLARTTFDADGPSGWGYGYFYGEDGLGIYEGPDRAYYDPNDLEMTNAMCRFAFDLTALPGYSNYGVGFGAPQYQPDADPALFISTNRSDYIFSFDCRVDGLRADQTTVNAEMQVQFMNSAVTPNNILQVNLAYRPGSQWARFSFHLDEGGLGADTSDKTFALNREGITALQFNVNCHLPSDAFDFDADNVIFVDNLDLEVIARSPDTNAPLATFGFPIADWNFDDKPISSSYQYAWTERGEQPTMTATYDVPETGVGGSNAWVLQMDNSVLANDVPAWAGGGTGGEGAIDATGFTSDDLTKYRLTFDGKVMGLAADRLTTSCMLQLFLRAPDDTFQPADEDTDRDLLVRLDFALTDLEANWQTLSFPLSKGLVGGGSKTNFTAFFNKIEQVQTQWQIENATAVAHWDFDADNALAIDNFKLERMDAGCPPLNISKEGNELIATWNSPSGGSAKLQRATKVEGPYTDVSNATSPHRVSAVGGPAFFRTVLVPAVAQ